MLVNLKVGLKRLLMVADKLETLPRERFDYACWVGEDWGGAANLSCGTTACALGWATTIPALRKAGLRLTKDAFGTTVATKTTMNALVAAQEIFGISLNEAECLFYPKGEDSAAPGSEFYYSGLSDKATPKQVAKHIRKFVKAKQKALMENGNG